VRDLLARMTLEEKLAAQLWDRNPRLRLLKQVANLLLREPALPHRPICTNFVRFGVHTPSR
jgi:hypothetical protein